MPSSLQKMQIDLVPNELKNLKYLEKNLIAKRVFW